MSEDYKTCKERIKDSYEFRKNEFENSKKIFDKFYNDEVSVEEYENELIKQEETILSVTTEVIEIVTILFSWGGPSDYIQIHYNTTINEIKSIKYFYADWYDVAEIDVEENTAIWDFAASFIDIKIEMEKT